MLALLLSLVWSWRMILFKLSGLYCSLGASYSPLSEYLEAPKTGWFYAVGLLTLLAIAVVHTDQSEEYK